MVWISLILILACAGACVPEETGAEVRKESRPIPRLLAVVNGMELDEKQFEKYLAGVQGELYQDPTAEPPRRELFREFVITKLLLAEAQKEGFRIGDEKALKSAKSWTVKEQEGAQEFTAQVRDYLTAQSFLHHKVRPKCEVTLGEMQRYYNAHHNDFIVGDQVHVLEILVDSRETIETLANLTESVGIGGFMELARQYSKGITASSGGDLGFFRRGELPEKFENVIFALEPGEISEPVESTHGFHLFLLEEWLPAHPRKFYEVRDHIFEELVSAKERNAQEAYLTELLAKAAIEIYDESLEFRERENHTDVDPAE